MHSERHDPSTELEDALVEYVERYGLTEKARDLFLKVDQRRTSKVQGVWGWQLPEFLEKIFRASRSSRKEPL